MAEDQKKLDLTIGLKVEGGDNAVQRIGKLTREISQLEKNSGKLRGFANELTKAIDAGKGAEEAARGLKSQREQAQALAPAITSIKNALKGMPKDVLSAVGINDKSIRDGGKNVKDFQQLTQKISAARDMLTKGAGRAVGLAQDLEKQRATLVNESRAVTKLRDRIAKDAVASDSATSAQRVRATLSNAQAEIAAVKSAAARVQVAQSSPATAAAPAGSTAPIRRYVAGGATVTASQPIAQQARAATGTSDALDKLAKAGDAVGGSQRKAAAGVDSLIKQLQAEMRAAPKAGAALHTMLRRLEAASNPRYASGFRGMGQAIGGISNASQGAASGLQGVRQQGDSFLGQVKQVAVLATSFSVLQGVAGKLQEGFAHLTGGIIGFNQVLERTEVGFRRLFINQQQQVEVSRSFGDTAKEVEYMALGYDSAGEAASGMVDTIREFANVTPFRFEELAQATLRMRAFGFSLDEVLYKTEATESGFGGAVVAIGDAVSALGGGALEFQRITYALGQMKQAGRVYQNDMMQLANAGIGGYKYIADQLRREITEGGTGQRKDVMKGQQKLYDELSNNAIETVRRLTTNGKISGEAAARAIILGLQTDFGGGMKDFSRTFVGAWTTLADTSQSLVATAFDPFYKQLVYKLYEIGQFFQTDAASDIAKSFQGIIQTLATNLFNFVNTASSIFGKLVNDISGAFNRVQTTVSSFGLQGGNVFKVLGDGIGVVSGLLQNDMTRGIIVATIALKAMSSLATQNPMLAMISGIIFALGILKEAYRSNFAGFATALDRVAASITPVIQGISENLLPILLEIGAAIGAIGLTAFIEAFKILAVSIEIVYRTLGLLLEGLRPFASIIGVIIGALVVRFAYGKVVQGFLNIAGSVTTATAEMVKMSRAADRLATMKVGGRFGGMLGPGGKGAAIGGAAIAGGMAASMAGASDVGGALFTSGMFLSLGNELKQAFGGNVLGEMSANIKKIGTSLLSAVKQYFVGGLTMMSSALGGFFKALPALLGPLGPALIGLALGAAAIAAIVAITENQGGNAPKPGSSANSYLTGGYSRDTTNYGGGLSSGAYGMDRAPVIKQEIVQIKKATAAELTRHQQVMSHIASERAFRISQNAAVDAMLREQRRLAEEQAAAMKLLIGQQNKEAAAAERKAKAQAKYNFLLGIAQQKLQASTQLLENLAKGALKDLLEPDEARINPYTGMAQSALELKDVLEIEQDMLFTNFKNAQGTTKSFDEFADILNSIVPLQAKDRTEGKLNLIAVRERLKIEKERRKELELIVRAAENEYDLGLATLQQYDESIDPLQRAVQLRAAQRKYEDEIQKSRMAGLELAIEEAEQSDAYAEAQKAMEDRLNDISEGQDYILSEMEARFEQFNERVANIMANPTLGTEERSSRLKENQDALVADLAKNFGITEAVLQEQFDKINNQMATARDASDASFTAFMTSLTNPVIPEMTWGQTLGINLGNVFTQIIGQLEGYYARIVELIGLINGAASSGKTEPSGPAGPASPPGPKPPEPPAPPKPTVTPPVAPPRGAGGAFTADGVVTIDNKKIVVKPGDTMSEAIAQANALNKKPAPPPPPPPAKPTVKLPAPLSMKASGGLLGSGLTLVGERGPELILPKSSGLVLNNSISSRLMGMLSGTGSPSSSNVTINVNNPVIRNDADIRKLATEISKVQASQFRTQGGRL